MMFMPYGLGEFAEKITNRALQFVYIRRCGCEGAGGSQGESGARFHYHGLRMYCWDGDAVESRAADEEGSDDGGVPLPVS